MDLDAIDAERKRVGDSGEWCRLSVEEVDSMTRRIRDQDAEIARLQSAVHDLEDMVSAAESRANDRSSTIAELRALCGATAEREAKLREAAELLLSVVDAICRGMPVTQQVADARNKAVAALETKGGDS